ncbi:MAG: hypothetical protein IJ008_03510 [Clostridia bacterium]|nr:hypothetical protein [Clostridia bacterium]
MKNKEVIEKEWESYKKFCLLHGLFKNDANSLSYFVNVSEEYGYEFV